MLTVIVANGDLGDPGIAGEWLDRADLVIAADGGLDHCLGLGREPDLLIGDLDSVSAERLDRLENAGTDLLQHPRRKDATDLELALSEAHHRRADEALVLGAMGGRWDQSVANLLLGAHPAWPEMRVRYVSGPQQAEVLRAGRRLEFDGSPDDLVSLIPVGGDARGITTRGLAYPLSDGSLKFGTSRGVSNLIERTPASVELAEGRLLCLTIRGGAISVENGSTD